MPRYAVTTQDGQEGSFDPVEAIVQQNPGLASARITGYDKATKTIKAVSPEGDIELNVPEYAKSLGLNVHDLEGDFNDHNSAVDSSPVSMWQRFKLGLANSEAGEAKTLLATMKNMGASPEIDAMAEGSQKKALAMLKADGFDDAKISNGEYVVKKDGMWHKVDAPGISKGDIAQFAASNGLNILGSIAGGAAGLVAGMGVGSVPGAMAGSAAGASAAEGAEEMLRIAIVGGEVDVEGAAADIVTEGLMGLVGETAGRVAVTGGKVAAKGAAKLIPDVVSEASKATVNGMKAFSAKASAGVKDMAAELFGNIGPGMSARPMRAMIESPETVQKGLAVAQAYHAGDDAVKTKIVETMRDGMRMAVDKAHALNHEKYGQLVETLAGKADDTVTLNLDETLSSLETMLKGASPEKRNFLDPVLTKTRELIEAARPPKPKSTLLDASGKVIETKAQDAVLKGPAAIRAMHKLKMSTTEKLGKLGAFDKNIVDSLTDADTLVTAMNMEDFLDSKILSAADSLNLGKEVEMARKLYGETKDALKPIRSKLWSPKTALKNSQQIARGKEDEIGVDTLGALANLDRLQPGANVGKAINEARIIQGGIEAAPRWIPKPAAITQASVGGGALAATGLALGSNPMAIAALPVAGALISPRFAAFAARNVTSSGFYPRGAAKIASIPAEGAAKAARMLTTRASVSGFMHTLTREAKDELLANPDSFKELIMKAQELEGKMMNINEATVMDAAMGRLKANPGAQ